MKNISSNVPNETYKLMVQKCEELGLNKSQYIKLLINNDLGIKNVVLKPKKETQGILSHLKSAFGVKEITEITSENVEKSSKKRIRNSSNNNAQWVIPNSAKSNYLGELNYLGEQIRVKHINPKSHKNSVTKLKINMSELLVIREEYTSKKGFAVGEVREFAQKFNIKQITLNRIIYNLIEGNFEELISDFK